MPGILNQHLALFISAPKNKTRISDITPIIYNIHAFFCINLFPTNTTKVIKPNPVIYHSICLKTKLVFSSSNFCALPIVTILIIANKIMHINILISILCFDMFFISSPLLSYTLFLIYTIKKQYISFF